MKQPSHEIIKIDPELNMRYSIIRLNSCLIHEVFQWRILPGHILRLIQKRACSGIQNSGCIRLNGMKMEGFGFWISVVNQALVEKLLTISYSFSHGEKEKYDG